jgi:hypothetical protein
VVPHIAHEAFDVGNDGAPVLALVTPGRVAIAFSRLAAQSGQSSPSIMNVSVLVAATGPGVSVIVLGIV